MGNIMNHIVSVNKMVLFVLLLAGCENIIRKHVPLYELLHEIADEPYILNDWDCTNKAAKYYYAVKAAGYDPVIILYKIKGGKHAVVKVGETYIDPTSAKSNMLPPKNIVLRLKEEDFWKYGDEYRVR